MIKPNYTKKEIITFGDKYFRAGITFLNGNLSGFEIARKVSGQGKLYFSCFSRNTAMAYLEDLKVLITNIIDEIEGS